MGLRTSGGKETWMVYEKSRRGSTTTMEHNDPENIGRERISGLIATVNWLVRGTNQGLTCNATMVANDFS